MNENVHKYVYYCLSASTTCYHIILPNNFIWKQNCNKT